ncbi:MAG: 50S ribosomal protein L4 [Thermoproteota archaeon]|nr:50S ribosomal protein L4 [Thermoproteota archaeon]
MGKATAKVFNLKGKPVRKVRLPKIFQTPLRPDVIKRVVVAIQSHRVQPQGRDVMAGERTTAESRGVGLGISRIPRTKGPAGRGALVTGTVGGRATHPPVSEKKIKKKVPKKERRLATRSAIAATGSKEIATSRGHVTEFVPDFPLVVSDDFQRMKKTGEVEKVFMELGVWPDVYRVKKSRKIRAGKGKRRGRRTKQGVGPLLVISKNQGILQAARNLPGIKVVNVRNLNAELLAPGTHPGRLTIWTESAIKMVETLFGGD